MFVIIGAAALSAAVDIRRFSSLQRGPVLPEVSPAREYDMTVLHADPSEEVPGSSASALGSRLIKPGEHAVDVPIICVVTRFRLRRARFLLPTYLGYRRVVKEAARAQTPGLLRSAFLIENSRTCYTLSIWANHVAIPHFGTNVPSHVKTARRVFGRVCFRESRGPEIWSTKWQLSHVSNNLNWEGFDLRGLILRAAVSSGEPCPAG